MASLFYDYFLNTFYDFTVKQLFYDLVQMSNIYNYIKRELNHVIITNKKIKKSSKYFSILHVLIY